MWNISNIISLVRLLLSIPLAIALIYDEKVVVIILALFALLSDKLDGYFARKHNQITELGKILDPIADKVFVGTGAVILIIMEFVPLWFGIAVLSRDIIILSGGLYAKHKLNFVLPSNVTGKITVFVIGLVLLGAYLGNGLMIDYGLYIALVAMVLSLVVYGVNMAVKINKSKINLTNS